LFDTCEGNYTLSEDARKNCKTDLTNVTGLFTKCEDSLKVSKKNETDLSLNVSRLRDDLEKCETKVGNLETEQKDRIDGMSKDFGLIGHAKQCVKQCGEFEEIVEKYVCVAAAQRRNLCAQRSDFELEQNEFGGCLLIGDATWMSLDWGLFLVQNPIVGGLLVALLILSMNGLLLTCLWVGVCVRWSCKKKETRPNKSSKTPISISAPIGIVTNPSFLDPVDETQSATSGGSKLPKTQPSTGSVQRPSGSQIPTPKQRSTVFEPSVRVKVPVSSQGVTASGSGTGTLGGQTGQVKADVHQTTLHSHGMIRNSLKLLHLKFTQTGGSQRE